MLLMQGGKTHCTNTQHRRFLLVLVSVLTLEVEHQRRQRSHAQSFTVFSISIGQPVSIINRIVNLDGFTQLIRLEFCKAYNWGAFWKDKSNRKQK